MGAVSVAHPSRVCCTPNLSQMTGRLATSTTGVTPVSTSPLNVTANPCNLCSQHFTAMTTVGYFNLRPPVRHHCSHVGLAAHHPRPLTLFMISQLASRLS
jgi:hypothetical protein